MIKINTFVTLLRSRNRTFEAPPPEGPSGLLLRDPFPLPSVTHPPSDFCSNHFLAFLYNLSHLSVSSSFKYYFYSYLSRS